MMFSISQHKAIKIFEWILFVGFAIIAGWFASGVIDHFFSNRTSFSQYEGEITKYPVVVMTLKTKDPDLEINYRSKGMKMWQKLEIGENHLLNDNNQTEKVLLDSLEDKRGRRAFRIIHITPLSKKEVVPAGYIKMYVKGTKEDDNVFHFHLTSLEKSPGFVDRIWRDGNPLLILIRPNTKVIYNMQPQITKYLEQLGKCQNEAFHVCIASQIDMIESNECSEKCIPNVFSNMGKKYNTEFCLNNTSNQQCMFDNILKQEIVSNCKKSCTNLEYFGEKFFEKIHPSDKKDYDLYFLHYRLINQYFKAKIYEEYQVYDAIGMVGSVGGTLGMYINIMIDYCNMKKYLVSQVLRNFCFYHQVYIYIFILGMFIGFSMTGAISWILKYFKDYK